MNPVQVQQYCKRYFEAVGAIIHREEPYYLQVELPRDVDKELIERPFFWKWAETIGQQVEPTIMNLVFTPDKKVEDVTRLQYVCLGNQQLNKIFQSAQRRGRIVRMIEKQKKFGSYIPYFIANIKISYVSDRRRDVFTCDAVEMESGTILRDVWRQLITRVYQSDPKGTQQSLQDSMESPWDDIEFCKTQCQSAWADLKADITRRIYADDHSWATAALEYLEQDKKQLEAYYEGLLQRAKEEEMETLLAERETRLAELTWRRQPNIQIEPFSAGLFFLQTPLRQENENG